MLAIRTPNTSSLVEAEATAENVKKLKAHNVRFSRIGDVNKIVFHKDELRNNEFNFGDHDYGARAFRDLAPTRGKGFTKEKNKKKRGSYSGGAITMESRSIKFE